MKLVPGMTLRPSGPDLSLLAPLQLGPVSQPANPPVIWVFKVFVFMSMTSTDLLFRSVKNINPLPLSTSLMSNEKLLWGVMFVTGMDALVLTSAVLGLLLPPPQATSRTLASAHAPRVKYIFISSSWSEILLKGVLVLASTCSPGTGDQTVCLRFGGINE